jgi:hypothetical protein
LDFLTKLPLRSITVEREALRDDGVEPVEPVPASTAVTDAMAFIVLSAQGRVRDMKESSYGGVWPAVVWGCPYNPAG